MYKNYKGREDLLYIVELANGKDYNRAATIENSLELFKNIKKVEKTTNELNEAKCDLEMIFNVPTNELKGLTKNKIYMLHQSMMVNQIYMILKGVA